MKFDKTIFVVLVLFVIGALFSFFINHKEQDTLKFSVLSEKKEGIVSLNPAATEIIYALKCENSLKAVSRFCNFPPQAKDKKNAGDSLNPDFETILTINPKIIIVMGKSQKINTFCFEKGIEVLEINLFTMDEVFSDIIKLSEKFNCRSRADIIISNLKSELEFVKTKTKNLKKVKVFISMSPATADSLGSIATVNGKTLISQLVEIAGGENIFADIDFCFPTVSKESLIVRQPEIIIEPSYTNITEKQKQAAVKAWQQLNTIDAVKSNKIYFPDADLLLKPGPRISQAALSLAKIFHPEVFNIE